MDMEEVIKEWSEETGFKAVTKYEVCFRCRGEGSHVNPAIDGHGVSAQEWNDWGEESQDMYLSGGYDIPCEVCNGLRVTMDMDLDAMTREQNESWNDYLNELIHAEEERAQEIRMGC